MKVAVYPGSFNPWHEGHDDILQKALLVFDNVIIAQGVNPDKPISANAKLPLRAKAMWGNRIQLASYHGLLRDFLEGQKIDAIVKGLRTSIDFEYEKTQLYWNEDLGILIPTVYIIADRKLVHVSSSAIRTLEKFKV